MLRAGWRKRRRWPRLYRGCVWLRWAPAELADGWSCVWDPKELVVDAAATPRQTAANHRPCNCVDSQGSHAARELKQQRGYVPVPPCAITRARHARYYYECYARVEAPD